MNTILQRGFTLIEVLVSLVIGIIVITLSVPAYQLYIASNRVTAITNQFISSVQLARSQAIARSTAISLCAVSPDEEDVCANFADGDEWAQGWFIFTDSGVAGSVDGDDEILYRNYNPPLNTTLVGPERLIVFNAEGYLDNAANGEYLGNYIECYTGGRGKIITIGASGKPSVSSSPCSEEEDE